MMRYTLLVIFVLFLNGCSYHYGTQQPKDFYGVSQLSELEGVYKNHGDWEGSGTLASIIWNGNSNFPPKLNHEDIEFIEVSSIENSLTVRAIQGGCSVYEQTYILGKDFKFEDGKIFIRRDSHLLSRGAGDIFLGPSYDEQALGIDTNKDGKYKSKFILAGLGMLVIPLAGTETRDVRFERVSGKPLGYRTCEIR